MCLDVFLSFCPPLMQSCYCFIWSFFVTMLFPCNSKVSYMASNLSTSNLYPRPLKIWLLTFWFFSVAFIFYINYFLTSFLGLILSRCKWLKLKSFGHFFCNIEFWDDKFQHKPQHIIFIPWFYHSIQNLFLVPFSFLYLHIIWNVTSSISEMWNFYKYLIFPLPFNLILLSLLLCFLP